MTSSPAAQRPSAVRLRPSPLRSAALAAAAALPGLALAQESDAERFAQSVRLPAGTYEAAATSALAGVPLPPGSVRLKSFGAVNAESLKQAFTSEPALYGVRCGEQELIAFPSGDAALKSLFQAALRLPGAAGLNERKQAAVWKRGNVFSYAFQGRGMVLLASCRTTPELSGKGFLTARRDFHAGATPTAVMADALGRVVWCGPRGALRQKDVFSGSATTLTTSRDGRTVVAGGWDRSPTLKVLDSATGAVRRTIVLSHGAVQTALDAGAATLLVQDGAGIFTVYDLGTGRALRTWDERSLNVFQLQGGGDGVFTQVERSGPIKIVDGRSGRPLRSLYSVGVLDHALTPDGQWAVTVERDGVLRAFKVRSAVRGLTREAEASVTLGALTGALLMPGREKDEVVALVPRRLPDGRTAFEGSAWRVGSATVQRLPDTDVRAGEAQTLNSATRRLVSVPQCLDDSYR